MGWYEEQGARYREAHKEKARIRLIYKNGKFCGYKAMNDAGGWLLWGYTLLQATDNIHP